MKCGENIYIHQFNQMYVELVIVPLKVTFLFNIYSYFNLTINFINNKHKQAKRS